MGEEQKNSLKDNVQGIIGFIGIIFVFWLFYFGSFPQTPGQFEYKESYFHFIESKEPWSSYITQDELKIYTDKIEFIDNSILGTSSSHSTPKSEIDYVNIEKGVFHYSMHIKLKGFLSSSYNYVFQNPALVGYFESTFNPSITGINLKKSNTLLVSILGALNSFKDRSK